MEKIGQFKEYKGYVGSIEYDEEDELYYGKLLKIKDLVNYSASDAVKLYKSYKDTVDEYLMFLKEIVEKMNKENVKPVLMQLAEPEYMCPECGYKFYVYDKENRPNECRYCNVSFKLNE